MDLLTKESLERYLVGYEDIFTIEVFEELTSTNTVMKEHANDLAPWHVLIAQHQSEGKGRTGRRFYSPSDTGIYMSVLLPKTLDTLHAGKLMAAAAVAASWAIEFQTDEEPQIKWVNDIFINGKKTCGILTEAAIDEQSKEPAWLICGIGWNVYPPEEGFPEEVAETAGAIVQEKEEHLRAKLAATFLKLFYRLCDDLSNPQILAEYKARCFLLGEQIEVHKNGEVKEAEALDITDDFALRVRYADGGEELLTYGEVSTRFHKAQEEQMRHGK